VSVDTLVARSGLTADKVSSMLLLLELEGHVSSAPGGRYLRTGQTPG
jgi:DNA processing protein